ncbi:MAG TPA: PAS domain S-box protein [Candidatus Brocadiia bacterium]|nr:PAS domain S-box protein [Candidatus Brocadiales bacterium]
MNLKLVNGPEKTGDSPRIDGLENHLGASEKKYKRFCEMILSSIPSSILIFDSEQKVVFANKNFLIKSRKSEENTIGKGIDDILPPVLTEYSRLSERIRRVFEEGRRDSGQEMLYRAPGLPSRVYYYNLTPLKDDNRVVESVMLLMDDITEQVRLREKVRRTERHLASVVESANDIVVSMDPYGLIMTWNNAAERISGFIESNLLGNHLATICPDDQQVELRSVLHDLAKGRTVKNVEINLMTKGFKYIPISWSFSLMRDDENQIVGIVGVGRDLTERRALEAQLVQSAKLASLGVLAGGIAHEIRNPLGVSSAAAQLMLEYPDDAKLRCECSEKIYSGIQQASRIIEGLLRFARPSEGRFELTKINTIVEEALVLIARQMSLQQIKIRKCLAPNLPQVLVDKKLLEQVFLNLILNAANAIPQGGDLTIFTRSNYTDSIKIIFKDTGCGIPEENLDKIFDPFFTTMPVGMGTGLGLSISYGIIKQHNGFIDVESIVGKGSTFTITLPIGKNPVKNG